MSSGSEGGIGTFVRPGRSCDRSRRSALLCSWSRLLVRWSLLRLDPGTLGRMASRPPRLDSRTLRSPLIDSYSTGAVALRRPIIRAHRPVAFICRIKLGRDNRAVRRRIGPRIRRDCSIRHRIDGRRIRNFRTRLGVCDSSSTTPKRPTNSRIFAHSSDPMTFVACKCAHRRNARGTLICHTEGF
jgi:hypothetical protein